MTFSTEAVQDLQPHSASFASCGTSLKINMTSISGWRCELEARVTDHHWCVKWQCCMGVCCRRPSPIMCGALTSGELSLPAKHFCVGHILCLLEYTQLHKTSLELLEEAYRELMSENELVRTELERKKEI